MPDLSDQSEPTLQPICRDGVLPRERAGLRLDACLAQLWPEFSRSQLRRWIEDGSIQVDGKASRPRERVRGGERVELKACERVQAPDQPEAIPLHLLYQDEALMVVDKPAGLVVHPGAGNRGGTLVNALLALDPILARLPRAGIVHRLDKDTSGALLVARSASSHQALGKALARREIEREYLALVQGEPVSGFTVDAPLDRHPTDRLRRAVVNDGRPAVTHARIESRYPGYTLLRCRLETGRTHQIRVHLAHMRLPIVGDPLYGGRLRLPAGASETLIAALRGFRRQALHARRLAFAHPEDGRWIETKSALPEDFAALLAAFG